MGSALAVLALSLPAVAQAPVPPAATCVGDPLGRRWRVGVVPQRPASQTAASWTPVLREVGQRSGQCFTLVVPATIPAFEQLLRSGNLDFAYLNPYHQLLAHRWQGFVPLVRDRTLLEGLVVVPKASPIHRIRNLQGAVVAFPAPNAFAASLLIRALLARESIRISPLYLGNHSNVYRSVALQRSQAGGGVNLTLEQERPEVRDQLRVHWTTPVFPAHPFSASGRVPAAVRSRVRDGFELLGRSPAGRRLLQEVQPDQIVRASQSRDYAPLEQLHLERFAVADGG